MSGALYNLAAMTVASTGTGTITLGSAAKINGVQYLSFASAGVPDGALVYYSINDPGGSGASEVGSGTYTASGTTLTRTAITSTNSNNAINMSASAIVRILPPTNQFREVLTGNRTYYVRTDGSNSNTGLVNSAGGAFLTLQKAIDVVASLDISIYNVTISVADGTYTGTVVVTGPWIGSGTVTLTGNTVTPANCIINTTNCISATTQGRLNVAGFKLISTGIGLYASTGSSITTTGAMEFGANSSYCAYADNGGVVRIGSAFTISGAGGFAALGAQSFGIINVAGIALTVSGTPAFSSSFASSALSGLIVANSFTFSGAGATGPRYSATSGGGIFTAGGGANVFPGNSAGSATSPGWYN